MSSTPSKPFDRKRDDGDLFAALEPKHFAGNTAFKRLSAEQKLLWLAHAASFALEARKVRARHEQGSHPDGEPGFAPGDDVG